jgi:tetratricopeptide (TPR) repeat protein
MTRSRPPQNSFARARWLAALVFSGFSSFGNPSYAQGQTELPAREHFERGVEASRQGDLVLALDHFEKAQALTPNQTVLYNLGQTYSALGRPVEALGVLERYLEADGASGDAARRREVEDLVRRNLARVGMLEVALDPSDASLDIDGVPAKPSGAGTVRIAAGRHLLTATKVGYRPSVVRVAVKAGEPTRVRLGLEPVSLDRDAFIEPSCATPDVTVVVDGVAVGRTPRTPLVPVASGAHRVRFERPGFALSEATVAVNPKSIARVPCELRLDPGLSASESAELRVLVGDPKAQIRVNGTPFRQGKLPLGPHVVEVTAPGFQTFREVVTVRRAMQNTLRVKLEPTAERERAERRDTRQIVAYSSGGVGIALGTVAAILYATNQARYEDWSRDQRALSNELAGGETRPDHAVRAADLQERAASIQRTDDIALGAGIVGGVLVAVSVGLLLSGEEPSTASRQNAVSHPLRFTW